MREENEKESSSLLLEVINDLEDSVEILTSKTEPIRMKEEMAENDKKANSDVVTRLMNVVLKINKINKELEV